MTALILGGSGRLGAAMRTKLPGAAAPTHAEIDLADTASIQHAVAARQPDLIVNCAAYTVVDAAEDNEAEATLINGQAVGELAAVAARLAIPFVTFSTDYVFDGVREEIYTESALPNPLNAYGRSKLVGEELALGYPGSLVIRTSWLLATTHPSFVSNVLARAAIGPVGVVDDQWGRPTTVDDLAVTTMAAIERGTTGLLHVASPPTITWFGLAQDALRFAGIDPELIHPVSSDALGRRAERPRHAVLGSERGAVMPNWRPRLESWLRRGAEAIGSDDHPATRIGPV